MNDFEKIGKQMPYRESDAEVEAMLQRITLSTLERAKQAPKPKAAHRRYWTYAASAAAVVAIAVGVAISTFGSREQSYYDMVVGSESMADVLDEVSDDTLEKEAYYTVNSQAEYYYLYAQSDR